MYMSQGAIFFTSYEFLSTLMFPEPEQEVHARSVWSWNEKMAQQNTELGDSLTCDVRGLNPILGVVYKVVC
jgi:hypothetical protein